MQPTAELGYREGDEVYRISCISSSLGDDVFADDDLIGRVVPIKENDPLFSIARDNKNIKCFGVEDVLKLTGREPKILYGLCVKDKYDRWHIIKNDAGDVIEDVEREDMLEFIAAEYFRSLRIN